jgi:hypothetical protein
MLLKRRALPMHATVDALPVADGVTVMLAYLQAPSRSVCKEI